MKTILVISTFDTKDAELNFLSQRIRDLGGQVVTMDVSVLGDPPAPTDHSKHDVATAAGSTIEAAIDSGDENRAMQIMARGSARLTAQLYADGKIDGMIALGGTMGTDLALDCAQALPLGVPKYIVSTVAFSPIIPAERLSPDIQMILWAGGLYGLNSICQSSLAQAAGAVLGAAQAAQVPKFDRPLIGMTSLGSSCLKYMKYLRQPLEDRGFEVAVFHATGMGGMAFEGLARQGAFAAVLDLCQQEFTNHWAGSLVTAGADRLTGAGASGTPQIVAPGAADLLDFAGWQGVPAPYADRPFHVHNRLIKSTILSAKERALVIAAMADRLKTASGPSQFIMPRGGVQEWDKPGENAHDHEALAAMAAAARAQMHPPIIFTEYPGHINEAGFAYQVLQILDVWISDGTIRYETRRI